MTLNEQQKQSISACSEALARHGVCVFPHDTIWGLIGRVEPQVLNRIAELKQRPQTQPFLMLIPELNYLKRVVATVPARYAALLEEIWPGPVTVIFDKHPDVPDWVTAGKMTIAVRLPDFEPLNYLLQRVNQPLLSTSVNRSKAQRMTTLSDGDPAILAAVDCIYRDQEPGLRTESSILSLTGKTPVLLRRGIYADRLASIIQSFQ